MAAALAHDPSILSVSGAWDPSQDSRDRLRQGYPNVQVFGDMSGVFEASDCVHIASPPMAHLQQLEAAVDDGLAVLCEKPLAVDIATARSTVDRLEAKGARAGVNFPFTSSFAVDQLGVWRDEGAIGAVQSVKIEIAFAAWPRPWQQDANVWLSKRMEGGFTREVVSHFLFLTLRQLGPISLVRHHADFPDDEDCETAISAELQAGGIPVTLTARVGGTQKPDHNLWVYDRIEGQHSPPGLGRCRTPGRRQWLGPKHRDPARMKKLRPLILKRQLDKVAAMARGETHGLATLREAFLVQELVETILGNYEVAENG